MNSDKKKILILAYDFPPYPSVGGLRPYAWLQYFHEFGLSPTIITRQWANEYGNELDYVAPSRSKQTIVERNEHGTIVRTAYFPSISNKLMLKFGPRKFRLIRKMITGILEVFQFLGPFGTKRNLYKEARTQLKNQKFNLILATAEPFVLFHYAAKLSKEFSTPWVADYRDQWTQNKARGTNMLMKFWLSTLERRITKNCSHIIIPTKTIQSEVGEFTNSPISVIPNGYNEKSFGAVSRVRQAEDILSFGFMGTIYPFNPIEEFLEVLNDFSDKEFRFNFYGVSDSDRWKSLIQQKYPSLINHMCFHKRMDNAALLENLASNNILILFSYFSIIGTKIYEYLALQRHILFCFTASEKGEELRKKYLSNLEFNPGENHAQQVLIEKSKAGTIVIDELHLKDVLVDKFAEFKSKAKIDCHTTDFEQYSRRFSIQKLAQILKGEMAE